MTGFDHPERAPRLLGAVTVALTAAAGALDVVTYFEFDQVFASTMTGNLVLLGLGIGQGEWVRVVDNVCAILGYCGGLAVGAVLCSLVMRRLPWRSAVGAALTAELVILLAVGGAWYGVDGVATHAWRDALLVVGSSLAMGVQAAALRYVGPSGTPTNFLTGTVTNWVARMFELHRPVWDGNSALRIGIVVVAALVGVLVQRVAPDVAYLLPVVAVAVSVGLMALVTRANHGSLIAGPAEFPHTPGEPDAGRRVVTGRVRGGDGGPAPAVLTLVDHTGAQAGRAETAHDGRFRLAPPASGDFLVIASPRGDTVLAPHVVQVSVDGVPVDVDVVLSRAGTRAPS